MVVVSNSGGGRVDATRALNPRENDEGRVEKRCVWKARVYAEENVVPIL